MERLNFFKPYEHKKPHFEDQLTRAFLVVLRFIPLARVAFLDIVREQHLAAGNPTPIPSFSLLEQAELRIETQMNQIDEQDAHLLSIAITDERWIVEAIVEPVDRGAIYDGLIYYQDHWIFVIENKPFFSSTGAWKDQLNPKLPSGTQISVEPKPVMILWRDVVGRMNGLLENNDLAGAEAILLDDFLAYIDEKFPFLNPFDRFDRCKGKLQLLSRRCSAMLQSVCAGRVHRHRGWEHYIDLGDGAVTRAFLFPNGHDDGAWTVQLNMWPGNNVSQARRFFTDLQAPPFLALAEADWKIQPCLTFSSMGSNLVHLYPNISAQEYLGYWINNHGQIIGQYRRITEQRWEPLLDKLNEEKQITDDQRADLKQSLGNRDIVNVAPGFRIDCNWTAEQATELDRRDALVGEINSRILQALSTWGQTLPS